MPVSNKSGTSRMTTFAPSSAARSMPRMMSRWMRGWRWLQRPLCARIGEGDVRQRPTVRRAVLAEDILAELGADGLERLAARLGQFVRNGVRIQMDRAQRGQNFAASLLPVPMPPVRPMM